MPAALHRCVQKVMAEGNTEQAAYAICNASMNDGVAHYTKDLMPMSSRTVTDEGFLLLDAKLARTGIQEYAAFELGTPPGFSAGDVVKVYRPPEEVFKKASMDSFAMKPVTVNHPPVFLTKDNVKQYQAGHVGDTITKDGDHMSAKLLITDTKAIDMINSGVVELSNGYFSDYIFGKGTTPEGESYDARQVNIRGNHIAIVSKGRCGGTCRVGDSLPTTDCNGKPNCSCGDKTMTDVTLKIAGIDVQLPAQTAQIVKKAIDEATEADTAEQAVSAEKLVAAEASLQTVTGERDATAAKLATAEAKIMDDKALDQAVSDRQTFVAQVAKISPKIEWQGKTKDAIVREVVAAAFTNEDFTGKSAEYMQARFDAVAATPVGDSTTDAFKKDMKDTQGNKVADSAKSRQAMIEESRTAYLTPSKTA